jgi:hypothetical protein
MALAASLSAAEPPPRVPWSEIEAWAEGSPEKPAAVSVAEKPAAKPAPAPATASPTTPEPTATITPPDEPETAVTPVRPGDRRIPQPWVDRHAQISTVMGNRLRSTGANQHKQLFEIHSVMEQYDKAMFYLTAMLKSLNRWPEDDATGWIAGKVWETALLQGGNINMEGLKKYYDEWVGKERARLKLQASAISSASLKAQELYFEAHQVYFSEFKNIADVIKQKEREGESKPAALWEMCERFNLGHPAVPVVHLRFLYKLREWYPEYANVRSGLVQYRLAHALTVESLHFYKEAAEELECLAEKWPKSIYTTGGHWAYFAASFWMSYGDQLRDQRDRKAARDAWKKAQEYVQKLKTDYPACAFCRVDPDSGHNDADRLLRRIMDEDRLGSTVGK